MNDVDLFLSRLGYRKRSVAPNILRLSSVHLGGLNIAECVLDLSKLKDIEMYECAYLENFLNQVAVAQTFLERFRYSNMGCLRKIPTEAREAMRKLLRGCQNLKELQVHDQSYLPDPEFKLLLEVLGPNIELLSVQPCHAVHYTRPDIVRLASRCPKIVGLYPPINMPDGLWDTQNPYNMARDRFSVMHCLLEAAVSLSFILMRGCLELTLGRQVSHYSLGLEAFYSQQWFLLCRWLVI
jgi:hypothetical protein